MGICTPISPSIAGLGMDRPWRGEGKSGRPRTRESSGSASADRAHAAGLRPVSLPPRLPVSNFLEGTCKPDSVPPVARGWQPFLWDRRHRRPPAAYPEVSAGPASNTSLFGLAPQGVYRASSVAGRAVGSYPAVSPLPSGPKPFGRFVFCGTFRRVTPPCR